MDLPENINLLLSKHLKSSIGILSFGSVVLIAVSWFEVFTLTHYHSINQHVPLLLRAPVYVYALPLMVVSYWYRPLKDLFYLSRMLKQVEAAAPGTALTFVGNRCLPVQPAGLTENVFIYSKRYHCTTYLSKGKKYYFPLEIVK